MSKASSYIKNLLKSSSTLPQGSGTAVGGFMMGSLFGGHDHHQHAADGSCCGGHHHEHGHSHAQKHSHAPTGAQDAEDE